MKPNDSLLQKLPPDAETAKGAPALHSILPPIPSPKHIQVEQQVQGRAPPAGSAGSRGNLFQSSAKMTRDFVYILRLENP